MTPEIAVWTTSSVENIRLDFDRARYFLEYSTTMSASFQSCSGLVYCTIRTGGTQLCQYTPSARGKVTGAVGQLLKVPVSSALISALGSVLLADFMACARIITEP